MSDPDVSDLDAAPPADQESWELLNEELRHRLDVQRGTFERIETKAALVLAAAVGLVQLVARDDSSSGWLAPACAALALSAAAALYVVAPGRFEEVKPRSLVVGLWRWPRHKAAGEIANARLQAFELNVQRQGRMVRGLRLSIALLLIGAIMSAVHVSAGGDDGERPGPDPIPSTTAGP